MRFLACVGVVAASVLCAGAASLFAPADGSWRPLPLIADEKIADGWAHVGWGRFAVDGDSLRTDCDEKGMGLLVYTKERFGNCQIRVVYRAQDVRSNAGVFVRIDAGMIDRLDEKPPAVERDANGKLAEGAVDQLKDASTRELGPWYAVHHGYEVQICDEADEHHRTGSIYSLAKAASVVKKNVAAWRTLIITLRGDEIVVELDGQRVTTFDSNATHPPRKQWYEPKREPKRPQAGYIGLQNHDPGDVVHFKEVSVRPLESPPRSK